MAILSAVSFTVALGYGIVAPVIPEFARHFGVSTAAAGSVISAFALMRIAGALPSFLVLYAQGAGVLVAPLRRLRPLLVVACIALIAAASGLRSVLPVFGSGYNWFHLP